MAKRLCTKIITIGHGDIACLPCMKPGCDPKLNQNLKIHCRIIVIVNTETYQPTGNDSKIVYDSLYDRLHKNEILDILILENTN